jgi:class III poly(R)-hydroxyalkanoic acid synthase PhaE subunit
LKSAAIDGRFVILQSRTIAKERRALRPAFFLPQSMPTVGNRWSLAPAQTPWFILQRNIGACYDFVTAEVAMSDTKSGNDWSNDWQALQRQYWSAWSDLTRNQAGTTPDATTPWHEGLEQWSRMFGSAGKQSEAAERLMSSAKSYLTLMQSMLSFAAGKDSAAINMPSWLDALRGGMNFDPGAFGKIPGFDPAAFGNMPGFDSAALGSMPGMDAAALFNNPMAKALREISGQGLRSIEQLASGAAPMLQQMQAEGISWLKAPAFGYMREHQEHYQKMALAFAEFQEAVKQYNALIMKASQRSFEILESKVAERGEPGRQIDTVRALYDLWVDAAEEGYAEIALSDEFRKVYGDVVNAQMRVRSQLQQEVERIGVDLGMPTRTELNSVHKRLHDLRRELRDSQEAQRDPGQDGRDAEIAAMRAEIDDLRRLVENSGSTSAPLRAQVSATPGKAVVRPKRASARRRRAAAKRTHVATKTTAIAKPVPVAINPVPVAIRRASAAANPMHGSTRRPAGRAPQATVRVASPPPKAKPEKALEKDLVRPTSFGDAIAAMRRELSHKRGKKKKKAKAARLSLPYKTSARNARSSRSRT